MRDDTRDLLWALKRTGAVALATLLGLAVIACSVWPAHAQGNQPVFCGKASVATPQSSLIVSGTAHATLSVTNGSVFTLTTSSSPAIPVLRQGSIVGAVISVRTSTLLERHDGTNPTNDSANEYGNNGANGNIIVVCGSDLLNGNLKMVGNSGTAALVIIDFYTDGR